MTAGDPAIRVLTDEDADAAVGVINAAAGWYSDILDGGAVDGPEMTRDEWRAEGQRMTWFGAYSHGRLLGVIGLEYVADVALLRHWYVDPQRQRTGAGSALRRHLEANVAGVARIVAGTYRTNYKARGALERAGYSLSPDPDTVLRAYYDIPAERRETSVTYERAVEGRT